MYEKASLLTTGLLHPFLFAWYLFLLNIHRSVLSLDFLRDEAEARVPRTDTAYAVSVVGARSPPPRRGALGYLLETSVAQGYQSSMWRITCVGSGPDQEKLHVGGLRLVDWNFCVVIKSSNRWGTGF